MSYVTIWEHSDEHPRFEVTCPEHGSSRWMREPFARLEALRHSDCRPQRVSLWRRCVWRLSSWFWDRRYGTAAMLWPALRDDTSELAEYRLDEARRSVREVQL